MGKLLRITNGFEVMSDAKLLERANTIHQSMSEATSFFPTPVPTMTVFLDAINEFQSAVNAAASGDKNKMAERDTQKEVLIDILHKEGYYVLFASGGDRSIAQRSGFTLAKEPAPRPEMQRPEKLTLKLGDQSGVMIVKVKKVRGAVAYIHQYTTDPTLKEESWVNNTCSTTKCSFEGLTPGVMYYVRVAAVGSKDQKKFSDVVSKISA